jgi:hypothetical protein
MSPETLAVLAALSSVRWKHTQGRHADAVRAWQAAGRPDLEEARREAIQRHYQRRSAARTCPEGHTNRDLCRWYGCEGGR